MRKVLPIILLLLSQSLAGMAQSDKEGRKVRRITFNQEKVNIEYADGTSRQNVEAITINGNNQSTGIGDIPTEKEKTPRRVYTIDGRVLKGEPRQKGIYIVRENKGTKKTLKK